jgi:hypothetical protein
MKNWTGILLIFVLGACEPKSELSVENASRQFCDCFNAQTTGTIDDRLSPCLQQIADKKNDELNNSGVTNADSVKDNVSKFSLEVMLNMTRTCASYFTEINDLYDKMYSADTTEVNRNTIRELSARIMTEVNGDSIKSLLHKKVSRLIKAREFDMALQSIDSIKSLDNTDYGANLASAYIFNQKGLHDKAVIEINRAIMLSGDENLKLYVEITKMKRQTSRK